MARDPRHDVLFEPVPLGPVTARNRFFQVPHCNGMGHRDPTAHAWMRGVKAEGGWAVVCTEEVEIHHSSDTSPFVEGRIWDDEDVPAHERLVEKVHEHGALAGIELVHSGLTSANLYARTLPLGPSHLPVPGRETVWTRARVTVVDLAGEARLPGKRTCRPETCIAADPESWPKSGHERTRLN